MSHTLGAKHPTIRPSWVSWLSCWKQSRDKLKHSQIVGYGQVGAKKLDYNMHEIGLSSWQTDNRKGCPADIVVVLTLVWCMLSLPILSNWLCPTWPGELC